MKRIILSSILLLLLSNFTFAQVKKYGKSIAQDFEKNSNTKYKDANAIVLYKYQKVYYDYGGGRMYINIIIRERIKILNREGFKNATKKIHFYSKENLNIKAVTYTNKGGKVEKIKLKKSDIYEEKINKNWKAKIFTMPNISEGCIVEWEYRIQSPYIYNINDFVFQYNIPIQYYKGKITFPEELSANYKYTDNFKINFTKNEGLEIKIDDVEALKEEPFVNNIENYRGKISFEITKSDFLVIKGGYGGSENVSKQFSRNWEDVTSSLYKDSRFGDELKKTNYFKNDLQEIIKNAETELKKIDAILAFVKNKVKWNGNYGIFTKNGVKQAYKNGVGNVVEINLILTAMLRESGLDVSPILVSTRAHKKPVFPTRDGFNYVIAGVELLDKIILLDATEPYSLPNVLPKRVLNWQGRIIRKQGSSAFINLFPEKYNVNKSRLSVKMDESGNIKGNFNIAYKNLNALTYRKRWNGLANESLIKNLETQY